MAVNKSVESAERTSPEAETAQAKGMHKVSEMNFKFVTGREWRRLEPKNYRPLQTPVSYVILSYTMRDPCFTKNECIKDLLWMQRGQTFKVNLPDIRYNFIIGGDGSVYEIRGWTNQPSLMRHMNTFNSRSLYVGYMGSFKNEPPEPHMVEAQQELIKYGVRNKYISPKFNIYALRGFNDSQLSFIQIDLE